jgi:hypothetical protein
MKKLHFTFFAFLFLLLCPLFLQAQEKETRDLKGFNELSVGYGIDLFVRQANATEVVVKADADLMDKILTRVEGNGLKITMKKGNYSTWRRNQKVEVYVTMPDIRAISASGGADVEGEHLDLKELKISSSGGADVNLSLQVDELSIACSGGADVELAGKAQKMLVELSGGADLDANNLIVEVCDISTSGGADANIHVTKELSMRASGASDINYRGKPQVLLSKSSGAADIRAY